ncbi:MAG TPA: hypothetical protein V6C97_21135 [Oculatellaceae cyanobacterium]
MFDQLSNQMTWCAYIAPQFFKRWSVTAIIGTLVMGLAFLPTLGLTDVLFRLFAVAGLLKYLQFEIYLQRNPPSEKYWAGRKFNGSHGYPADKCGLSCCKLLRKSGLYSNKAPEADSLLYLKVMEDTGLALTGVRLYLERRLRRLAQLKQTGRKARGIDDLLGCLQHVRALNSNQVAALLCLNGELNKAVHGALIADEEDMKRWIVHCSPRLLTRLDELITEEEVRLSA